MNELLCVVHHDPSDGSLTVQMPEGIPVENATQIVAAVLRYGTNRGCKLIDIVEQANESVLVDSRLLPEPMVIQ